MKTAAQPRTGSYPVPAGRVGQIDSTMGIRDNKRIRWQSLHVPRKRSQVNEQAFQPSNATSSGRSRWTVRSGNSLERMLIRLAPKLRWRKFGRLETSPSETTGLVKELGYSESEAFFEEFNKAMAAGNTVRVKFDGTTKLTEDSELFKAMMSQKHVQNYQELVQSLQEMDTADGRKTISTIFDDSLLEHDELSKQLELPSGEVVEPGTVMLVLIIILATVSTGIVVNHIIFYGPIKVLVIPTPVGPATIEFQPVEA